jgi:preprotein translocase subunit SecG
MSLILLILQIIISVLLITVVLLQRSESDGFGLGSGGGSGLLSSRGQANLMTRTTAILAAAFMINSLLLATINARGSRSSIADEIAAQQQQFQVPLEGVASEKNSAPVAPVQSNEQPTAVELPVEQGMDTLFDPLSGE